MFNVVYLLLQLLDEFGDFSSSMLSRDKQRNDMKRYEALNLVAT